MTTRLMQHAEPLPGYRLIERWVGAVTAKYGKRKRQAAFSKPSSSFTETWTRRATTIKRPSKS